MQRGIILLKHAERRDTKIVCFISHDRNYSAWSIMVTNYHNESTEGISGHESVWLGIIIEFDIRFK